MQYLFTIFVLISAGCGDFSKLEDRIELANQTWCRPSQSLLVERVLDGDTVEINDPDNGLVSVRMLGAAAPETEKPTAPEECYGDEAHWFLEDLVLGQMVKFEYDVECTDIYDRDLSWLVLQGQDPEIVRLMTLYQMPGLYEDGSYDLLVNEMLVRMGYATVYVVDLDKSERYKSRLETAELVAETEGIGGWSECTDF